MTVDKSSIESSSGIPEPVTPTEEETQASTNAGVARATGVVALGNIASRVLGLVRDIVLTSLFGASAATDAFNAAVIIPKSLYDLLIGGHVNGAIIPVLSEVSTVKGRDALWRLVSILLSMVTVVLALLVLVLQVAAPVVIQVVSGGSDPATQELATYLLRMISPALIFMGCFAILSGTLYALRTFTWPAFATAVFNGAIVVVTLIFTPGPRFALETGPDFIVRWELVRPFDAITVVAVGWLVGSVAYVLLQLPGLRGARLRFTLKWRSPFIRQIGLLYIPVMFSLVMDTLIIRPFSYNLATQTGEGNLTIMNYATTLIQFPQGLVATAISVAILPTLARQAALIAAAANTTLKAKDTSFNDTLGLGLRLTVTLILPATAGLFVLATPIITLLFERGLFTAQDTATTAVVLRLYLIGLPFAALDLLLVYAFYARQDTLTPALVGLFSLGLYLVVALALMPHYGLYSLMVADSVKHITHAAVSGYLLHRRLGGMGDQRLLLTTLRTSAAVFGMATVALVLLPVATAFIGTGTLLRELLLVVAISGVSVAVFTVLAFAVRLEEWRWLAELVWQRLRLNNSIKNN